jgi:hypothetical protein
MNVVRPPLIVIADTYVRAWDHHVLIDAARAILAELDTAGYKIVSKDETEQMLERVKRIKA